MVSGSFIVSAIRWSDVVGQDPPCGSVHILELAMADHPEKAPDGNAEEHQAQGYQ